MNIMDYLPDFNSIATKLIVAILALFGITLCGCNTKEAVERQADKLTNEVIIPAVKEGLKQGVENLVIQAGAQAINPTYHLKFRGVLVNGFEGEATIGIEGIAGQAQVSSTSTEKTMTSPHGASSTGTAVPNGG